jgi:hypothetical protein
MSRRLLVLNVALAAIAVFFAIELGQELTARRRLPPTPLPRVAPASGAAAAQGAARPDQRALYNVIATKSLFSPSRTEAPVTPVAAVSAAPKPFLHGVVLDDAKSRAYLEDPTSKRIFGYAVGDQVGGGTLEAIRADRVVIVRPEGKVEVMLRDPAKPQPAAIQARPPGTPGGPAVGAGARPLQPGAVQNPFPGLVPQPAPGAPATAPGAPAPAAPPPAPSPPALQNPGVGPPRLFQQLAPDFFRRPPSNPYDPQVNQPRTN